MKQPVLFLGHGSPMNAIAENNFTKKLNKLAQEIPIPKAILIISAHWETKGSWLTGMEKPKTIHDFYGFPKSLYEVQYPAPGSPELVSKIQREIKTPSIHNDQNQWGLDHGTWSVLRHIYPNANIPIVQLSIDKTKPFEYHYELGQQISFLREQGVLIMGSGNIVHNLKKISWQEDAPIHGWALEFDQWVKKRAQERDFESLVKKATNTKAGQLSIPTPEHYLPLLYVLGAGGKDGDLIFDIEEIQNASIAMRSFRLT
ncbi:MAG: 4,5-DOPA dioxygenase extradiol [Halobacteriovorax sp.]|nr:4,5-DOPA dioxygenase extradiol [Halobacteriovorax sp.]